LKIDSFSEKKFRERFLIIDVYPDTFSFISSENLWSISA